MSGRHDDEFTEFVSARLGILRRVAYLLCRDWQRSDDLVQAAVTRLYVHWERARGLEHIEACAKTILVREFLGEQRSSWAKRVRIGFALPDSAALAHDSDAELDMRAALAGLAPRQRATIVLRFYCDLSVEQTAELLGCTESSQAARPDRRSHCMDEREVRDMLHKIASDEAPPSRVSIGLALSKGLRRRRTRRIYWSAGPPVAAAAAVALIAGLPQAFSNQNHTRPPAAHTGTPPTSKPPAVAPRTFSQTEPFATWGWLPSGMQAEQDDDTQTTLIEQLGVSTSATRANIQLAMNVAHACKLVRTTALLLECGLGTNGAPKLTKAPSIHGETAYWGPAGTLVWEYAKYGWAEINSLGVSKAHLLRVAATIRYQAVRYSYAFKFHGAPPTWRSLPEGSFDVVGGKPAPYGLSIGPVSHGQSALEIEVLPTAQTMYANDCGGWTNLPVYELPHGKAITIDGAKAVLVTKNVRDQHYQALCATDVHGLRLAISLYTDGDGTNRSVPGVGRLGGVLGVFHHLSLLGTNVRNWTTNPLH